MHVNSLLFAVHVNSRPQDDARLHRRVRRAPPPTSNIAAAFVCCVTLQQLRAHVCAVPSRDGHLLLVSRTAPASVRCRHHHHHHQQQQQQQHEHRHHNHHHNTYPRHRTFYIVVTLIVLNITRHTSHVTRHTSHVTRHTSHRCYSSSSTGSYPSLWRRLRR